MCINAEKHCDSIRVGGQSKLIMTDDQLGQLLHYILPKTANWCCDQCANGTALLQIATDFNRRRRRRKRRKRRMKRRNKRWKRRKRGIKGGKGGRR